MLGLRARDVARGDAPYQARRGNVVGRVWFALRHWRRTRPFWAGAFAVMGGAVILLIPMAPLSLMIHEGIAGVSGELFGAIIVAMGLFMWFLPKQRYMAGVITILLSLASFITSNFGGFFVGMLCGLIGGSLAIAWTPLTVWGLDDDSQPTSGTPAVEVPAQEAGVDLVSAEADVPAQDRPVRHVSEASTGRHRKPAALRLPSLRKNPA